MGFKSPLPTIKPWNQDINNAHITTQSDSPIDINAKDHPPCLAPPQHNPKLKMCCSIQIDFPPGKSAHSSYPYGIYDELGDPWDYSITGGVMVLCAKGCTSKAQCTSASRCCKNCKALTENGKLQGVLRQIKTGVHENTHLMYYSVGGLITILRRKTGEVCALRLRRFNDAQKLAGKAVALDNFKRWVMTVGSGKVEWVDRLARINLTRKGGIQHLLDLYDHAARQVYHPRNYTGEDNLHGLLLWWLGGAQVVGIAHHALNLPSLDTLCCCTLIPRLLISSLSPTRLEVEMNIDSNFESIYDLLQDHHIIHQILMLDELKTEE